jgi:hypothetical protein
MKDDHDSIDLLVQKLRWPSSTRASTPCSSDTQAAARPSSPARPTRRAPQLAASSSSPHPACSTSCTAPSCTARSSAPWRWKRQQVPRPQRGQRATRRRPQYAIVAGCGSSRQWLASPRGGGEGRRPLQELRLRLRHRRRVVPAEAQADDRQCRPVVGQSGEQDATASTFTTSLTRSAQLGPPAGTPHVPVRGLGSALGRGEKSIDLELDTRQSSLRTGRSTRPSGCMTLQIGWRHEGANWHAIAKR